MTGGSRASLRERWSRLVAPQHEVHAEEERVTAVRLGGTPLSDLRARTRVTACGTLHSVTLRPRAGVPALEAELYDGTGSLTLVWLGRRQIAGIEPGRRIRVHGLVTDVPGRKVIYNPGYELVPRSRD